MNEEDVKPSSFVVVRNQLFNDRLNADEPDGNGAIDEWCSGPGFTVNKVTMSPRGDRIPPTERIRMVDSGLYNQPAHLLYFVLNRLVCNLSEVSETDFGFATQYDRTFTCCPTKSVTSLVNLPLSSMGQGGISSADITPCATRTR